MLIAACESYTEIKLLSKRASQRTAGNCQSKTPKCSSHDDNFNLSSQMRQNPLRTSASVVFIFSAGKIIRCFFFFYFNEYFPPNEFKNKTHSCLLSNEMSRACERQREITCCGSAPKRKYNFLSARHTNTRWRDDTTARAAETCPLENIRKAK